MVNVFELYQIYRHLAASGHMSTILAIAAFLYLLHSYEGHIESKERFVIQRYLLIIEKKQNMQVL